MAANNEGEAASEFDDRLVEVRDVKLLSVLFRRPGGISSSKEKPSVSEEGK